MGSFLDEIHYGNKLHIRKKYNLFHLLSCSLLIAIFAFFSFYSLPLINVAKIIFPFDIVLVYVGSLYFSHVFSIKYVFILGLISDLLGHNPLGMNALIFILAREFIVSNNNLILNKDFFFIWLVFIVFITSILLCKWFVLMFLNQRIFNINLGFDILITSLFYPILHSAFRKLGFYLLRIENAK